MLIMFWINARSSTAELLFPSLRDGVWQSIQPLCSDQQLVAVMMFVWQSFSSPLFKMEENTRFGSRGVFVLNSLC